MKKLVIPMLLAFVTFTGVTLQASDAMKAIVGSYLEIQGRLAVDKLEGIKPAAARDWRAGHADGGRGSRDREGGQGDGGGGRSQVRA